MGQEGRNPTILIVDDEKDINLLIEKVLKLEGFQTVSCTNGKDALDILEKKSDEIVLVLLDLLMPGISGFEILKRVKSSNTLNHIRVVIFTAKYIQDDIQQGMLEGADGIILKPFSCEKLVNVIRDIINN